VLFAEFRGALEVRFSLSEANTDGLDFIARQFSPGEFHPQRGFVEFLLTHNTLRVELGHPLKLCFGLVQLQCGDGASLAAWLYHFRPSVRDRPSLGPFG